MSPPTISQRKVHHHIGAAGILALPVSEARRFAGCAGLVDLFVTNIPGPPALLWLAGARLLDAVSVAPLVADVPLGVAALSYERGLVSLHADGTITDPDVLATGVERGLDQLTAGCPTRPG